MDDVKEIKVQAIEVTQVRAEQHGGYLRPEWNTNAFVYLVA